MCCGIPFRCSFLSLLLWTQYVPCVRTMPCCLQPPALLSPSHTDECVTGMELASAEYVSQCLATICAAMNHWGKVQYADPSMMLTGPGYNATCGPLSKEGTIGSMLCVALPSTAQPTAQPPGVWSDDAPHSGNSGFSTGAIVGICVGGGVLLGAVAVAVCRDTQHTPTRTGRSACSMNGFKVTHSHPSQFPTPSYIF